RSVQAHTRRHQLRPDDRHAHQQRGDAEQGQQELRDPAADLRVGELEHQPMIRGMFWIRFWLYSISSRTSQGPAQISVSSITSRRGRKLSVCSLICVAAWNIATTRPT